MEPRTKGRDTPYSEARGFPPLTPPLPRHGLGAYRLTFRDMPKNPYFQHLFLKRQKTLRPYTVASACGVHKGDFHDKTCPLVYTEAFYRKKWTPTLRWMSQNRRFYLVRSYKSRKEGCSLPGSRCRLFQSLRLR